jgi:uncharacterized phage protein (TIGR02220 family)
MARIRTIKPEFWTSGQVVDCSLVARLMFIGIWNFCDDHGVHPASIKRLKMEVFPSDSIADDVLRAMIDELLAARLLCAYQVDGKGYWQVTGWATHQRIDKPTYRHPLPVAPAKVVDSMSARRVVAEQSTSARRAVGDQSSSTRPRNGKESKGSNTLSGSPDVIAGLDYLNEKTGKRYRAVNANVALIAARLRESTINECRMVIDAKVAAWQHDDKMCQYLRPATLFNATKFANYVGELGTSSNGNGRDWE